VIGVIYLVTQDFGGAFANYLYFVAPLWAISITGKLTTTRRPSVVSSAAPGKRQPDVLART
jgi:hypothetical protein